MIATDQTGNGMHAAEGERGEKKREGEREYGQVPFAAQSGDCCW